MDRNVNLRVVDGSKSSSLSARRAWIEIRHTTHDFPAPKVALRKESVDRNAEDWLNAGALSRSLSARRAWIEISNHQTVDFSIARRSPQGERG